MLPSWVCQTKKKKNARSGEKKRKKKYGYKGQEGQYSGPWVVIFFTALELCRKQWRQQLLKRKKQVKKGCTLDEQIQRAPLIPPIAKDCPDGFARQLIARQRDLRRTTNGKRSANLTACGKEQEKPRDPPRPRQEVSAGTLSPAVPAPPELCHLPERAEPSSQHLARSNAIGKHFELKMKWNKKAKVKCSLTKKKMPFSVPVAHCFTRGVINHQDCYRRFSTCCNAGVLFVCIQEKGEKTPGYYLAPKSGFLELYESLPGLGC